MEGVHCSYELIALSPPQILSRPTSSVPLQAWRTRDLCASIAASIVAPSNCFSLFQVASECTLGPLRSTCMAAALADFSEAVKEDGAAFCALGLDELLLFLEDDHLQVGHRTVNSPL